MAQPTAPVLAPPGHELDAAFAKLSPRLHPRPLGRAGLLIHGVVATLALLALGGMAFFHGLLAWSAGLLFLAYDAWLMAFVLRQTLSLRREASAEETLPPHTLGSLSVGVVIAAYNEAAVLERTIASLRAQKAPPDFIFIADDGSTDGTARLLTERFGFALPAMGGWSGSPQQAGLLWLRAPHGGKARTLNRALPYLNTDLIVTVDADTHLAPDALAQMQQAFTADARLVAATGVLTPVCDRSQQGRWFQAFQRYEYVRNFLARFAWMGADSLLLISGAFAAYRSQALKAVGGFDPECLVEDYEVIHRLYRHAAEQKLNWHVAVVGRAKARTSAPSTLAGFLRQRRRWFAGFLQTQYWNRDMTGNRSFGKLGTRMLPVKAMDTVQPFCGLMALAGLIGLGLQHRSDLLAQLLPLVAAKLAVDLLFTLWGLYLYRRWTDQPAPSWQTALAVTLLEPLCFQPLRHLGAVLGWYHFLTGRRHWGRQQRHAMA